MSQSFNYRHLYYFWVVAKEGGLARAAERLDMAIQTISTQVRELEKALGVSLLKPEGRNLVLTEAGVIALREADHIFALGATLPNRVREAVAGQTVRFNLGISDGIAKLMVHRLVAPILAERHLRLLCHEGEFEQLLAELAMHKLDAVLSDRAAPPNPALKLSSQLLASEAMVWYASSQWRAIAQRDFPHSLGDVPMLLPTTHAAVRIKIDQWLEREHVKPRVAGEFEDSALMVTFAAAGMGVFAASNSLRDSMAKTYDLHYVGPCGDMQEQFHWIYTQRKVMHPLSLRILAQQAG
jgi:LysR family transcriptional activator of nhaA